MFALSSFLLQMLHNYLAIAIECYTVLVLDNLHTKNNNNNNNFNLMSKLFCVLFGEIYVILFN